jgi:hypothetical protein
MLAALAAALTLSALPAPFRGDFDHDGKPDVALVVRFHGQYRLIVRRGARPRRSIFLATFDQDAIGKLFLDKASPGRRRTWCGKGGGKENDPCPREWVRLSGDTLGFGMQEASYSVALWTGRRFEQVLLSD